MLVNLKRDNADWAKIADIWYVFHLYNEDILRVYFSLSRPERSHLSYYQHVSKLWYGLDENDRYIKTMCWEKHEQK